MLPAIHSILIHSRYGVSGFEVCDTFVDLPTESANLRSFAFPWFRQKRIYFCFVDGFVSSRCGFVLQGSDTCLVRKNPLFCTEFNLQMWERVFVISIHSFPISWVPQKIELDVKQKRMELLLKSSISNDQGINQIEVVFFPPFFKFHFLVLTLRLGHILRRLLSSDSPLPRAIIPCQSFQPEQIVFRNRKSGHGPDFVRRTLVVTLSTFLTGILISCDAMLPLSLGMWK